jgi:hypothetical protein
METAQSEISLISIVEAQPQDYFVYINFPKHSPHLAGVSYDHDRAENDGLFTILQ